ncbi:MAG: helix-turn-helix domain-containing protein [Clostridia bacterium]|nr:helix-turn-helix domain-containing protein [Clostridia bacterium]
MTISEKISILRKEKNLSQEAFAEALGVSRQSVSKWESGSALPDTDKIIAMSELFGVSTDYLLKDDAVSTEPVTYNPPENPPENLPDEPEEPERNDDMFSKKKKKKKGKVLKILALILALCIAAAAIGIPSYFGSFREAWWELNGGKIKYPYVLVHGLGGWGEDDGVNDTVQYWGAMSMNLVEYLNGQGYEVHAPSVGPVSSTWDRTCELYAQLTGTRVDYGEAHSKAHNHERFGREYTEPLVAQWGEKINGGQRIKVNLIGHSFGGATVRLLASLLAYGSEEEKAATEGEISPLFEGGKGDWVYSVTALCAPHNGSSLTEVLDSVGGLVGIRNTTDLLTTLCFGVAGLTANADGLYDFKLEHFGITDTDFASAIDALTASGNDHAVYDLTPDGAAELNKTIKINPDAYYFSYSYSTTKSGSLLRGQVPNTSTLPILYPFALAMGSFKGTTDGGISIDETWQENDGLVSVVSARYPFGDEFVEMPLKSSQSEEEFEIQRGIWNVAPTKEGDHGKVIGLNSGEEVPKTFFTELFTTVDGLER